LLSFLRFQKGLLIEQDFDDDLGFRSVRFVSSIVEKAEPDNEAIKALINQIPTLNMIMVSFHFIIYMCIYIYIYID
jgi:hypothetical protein